jgi:hypothetical protein
MKVPEPGQLRGLKKYSATLLIAGSTLLRMSVPFATITTMFYPGDG